MHIDKIIAANRSEKNLIIIIIFIDTARTDCWRYLKFTNVTTIYIDSPLRKLYCKCYIYIQKFKGSIVMKFPYEEIIVKYNKNYCKRVSVSHARKDTNACNSGKCGKSEQTESIASICRVKRQSLSISRNTRIVACVSNCCYLRLASGNIEIEGELIKNRFSSYKKI